MHIHTSLVVEVLVDQVVAFDHLEGVDIDSFELVDIVLALEDNLADGTHVVDNYQEVVYTVDLPVVEHILVMLVVDML